MQRLATSIDATRFNSATAVTPWKRHAEVPWQSGDRMSGFNSATAVTPWKTQSRPATPQPMQASIRPRR